jgi:RNA polymerase sigma-70 factor (ECF subfamily)
MERLLMSIQPSLLRFLRALVGESGADDALQETLFQIYRKLEQLTAPELFRPWAFRIARRVGLRQMKRESRWLDEPADNVELNFVPTPEPPPSDESLQQWLDEAEISPASRVVLLLHFQEGMSLPEVSAALELPLGTVKSRLGYGLTVLRKRLNPARNE